MGDFLARIRTIKPLFFKDEDLAALPVAVRYFFIGLWTQADREGRMEDRPRLLKLEINPWDDDADVEAMLGILAQKFIIRYECDGRRYIQIRNFLKHQMPHYKEVPSRIPAAPDHPNSGYNASPVSEKDRALVFKRDVFKCIICGSTENLSIDHINPRCRGGGPEIENLQTLCQSCNSSKRDKVNLTLSQCQVNVDPTLSQSKSPIPLDKGNGLMGMDNRNGREGKEEGVLPAPIPKRTEMGQIVDHFATVRGVDTSNRAIREQFIREHMSAAFTILEMAENNIDLSKRAVSEIAKYLDAQQKAGKIEYWKRLELVAKHFPEWKAEDDKYQREKK